MTNATLRGGPRDGETLSFTDRLPHEIRFVQRTPLSDCDWDHVYTLRGTGPTGWYYEHIGYRLVAPPNETVCCPACKATLPWPAPAATP